MIFSRNFEISRKPFRTEILSQKGLLENPRLWCPKEEKLALIMDEKVASLFPNIRHRFEEESYKLKVFTVPQGENCKDRIVKDKLEDALQDEGFGKDTLILAIGGGATLDLAGYLAATFCRGVSLISVPTTLLAMVDASLGGKNGLNLKKAKNRIGTFYFPKKIILDLTVLSMLPEDLYIDGFSEMLKHALLFDRGHFDALVKGHASLKNLDSPYLEEAILKSMDLKMKVIEEDPEEMGYRELLNFGHTIGHALESASSFKMSHGKAVAFGIASESYLSEQYGLLSKGEFQEILHGLSCFHGPLKFPQNINIESFIQGLTGDKKRRQAKNRVVLLERVGKAYAKEGQTAHEVKLERLISAFDWLRKEFN